MLIGRESWHIGGSGRKFFGLAQEPSGKRASLGALIDWPLAAQVLSSLYPAPKGEKAWPPLAMFKALLLATWYDLSDVALAEALEPLCSDRTQSCVEGRQRAQGHAHRCHHHRLGEQGDKEAAWVKHRTRAPAHGYKAHIAADKDSGISRAIETTPANEPRYKIFGA
jgi:IS5 family transposase